jgi:hypothetical protein
MTNTPRGGEDDHADLPARIDAASAMNRLAHALVAHRTDVSTLRMIAHEADRLAAQIELQPTRSRTIELAASPRFLAAVAEGSLAVAIDDGAFVDLFDDSPASGSANPLSMGMRLRREGDTAVGMVSLGPGWEGAPGRGHGGIVAACVDETMGALLPIIGTMAFTGELTLRYRRPCPIATPVEFRAWLESTEGRKLFIKSTGTGPEGLFVEASATFIAVDLEQFSSALEGA